MFFSKHYKETLLKVFRVVIRIHHAVGQLEFQLKHVQEKLVQIMTNQEEFDAQIAAANEKIGRHWNGRNQRRDGHHSRGSTDLGFYRFTAGWSRCIGLAGRC
jgi:hypothetical protein